MGLEPRSRAGQGQPGASPQGEEPGARPEPEVRSFEIGRRLIVEAWEKVRAVTGAPGVDAVSIGLFEEQLGGNLYRLWNGMSSGSYFPGPVRGAGDTGRSWGRRAVARRARYGRPGGADCGGDAAGAEAGAGLPPRQLRLPSWAQRPGRAGRMPSPVLDQGLGAGS